MRHHRRFLRLSVSSKPFKTILPVILPGRYARYVILRESRQEMGFANLFCQIRELGKAIVASPQRLAQFKDLQMDTAAPIGLIQDMKTR